MCVRHQDMSEGRIKGMESVVNPCKLWGGEDLGWPIIFTVTSDSDKELSRLLGFS